MLTRRKNAPFRAVGSVYTAIRISIYIYSGSYIYTCNSVRNKHVRLHFAAPATVSRETRNARTHFEDRPISGHRVQIMLTEDH